jgi:hypothetical protein
MYLVGLIAVHARVGASHVNIIILHPLAFSHCDGYQTLK